MISSCEYLWRLIAFVKVWEWAQGKVYLCIFYKKKVALKNKAFLTSLLLVTHKHTHKVYYYSQLFIDLDGHTRPITRSWKNFWERKPVFEGKRHKPKKPRIDKQQWTDIYLKNGSQVLWVNVFVACVDIIHWWS